MSGWWASKLNPKGLSQGDILRILLSGSPKGPAPGVFLRPQQARGGREGYIHDDWATDGNGVGLYLSSGKRVPCLVISNSCDLDKPRDNKLRVLVAPMAPLSSLDEKNRENVRQQGSKRLFPLLGIPEMADHYTDLRSISVIGGDLFGDGDRVASMNEAGLRNLNAFLVYFFTRFEIPTGDFKPEL